MLDIYHLVNDFKGAKVRMNVRVNGYAPENEKRQSVNGHAPESVDNKTTTPSK